MKFKAIASVVVVVILAVLWGLFGNTGEDTGVDNTEYEFAE